MKSLPREIWRRVPSRPQMWASSHGRIMREPHIAAMHHGGYRLYISEPTFGVITSAEADARHLYLNYNYRGIGNVKVHQLVCEAFHGSKPDGCDGVRHLNENGLDNRPENVEWSTQEINLNDPNFKGYQRRRNHRAMAPSKVARRAGIYDSILDVARRRHGQ